MNLLKFEKPNKQINKIGRLRRYWHLHPVELRDLPGTNQERSSLLRYPGSQTEYLGRKEKGTPQVYTFSSLKVFGRTDDLSP